MGISVIISKSDLNRVIYRKYQTSKRCDCDDSSVPLIYVAKHTVVYHWYMLLNTQ